MGKNLFSIIAYTNPTKRPIKCAYQAIGSPIKRGATEINKIQVIIPFL